MDLGPIALSFGVAAIATTLAVLIGVPLAAALARRFPGRALIDALVTAPMVLPPTVLGFYVLESVGKESIIGRAYEAVTGGTIVFSFVGLVLAAFIGALPFVVRAARAAIEDVDPRFVQAARTLGATRLRAFTTITLPVALRGIAAGVSLGFAKALGDFGVTLMISGSMPGRTKTGALAIYDAVMSDNDSVATGLALIMSGCAVLALVLASRLVDRKAS